MGKQNYLISGNIDYNDGGLTIRAEIDRKVLDTWNALDEFNAITKCTMFLTPEEGFLTPREGSFVGITMMKTYMFYKSGSPSRNGIDIVKLLEANYSFASTINRVFRLGRGKSELYNVIDLHKADPGTGTFTVNVPHPMHPKQINRLLKSWRWWLGQWDRIGDESPAWIWRSYKRRCENGEVLTKEEHLSVEILRIAREQCQPEERELRAWV